MLFKFKSIVRAAFALCVAFAACVEYAQADTGLCAQPISGQALPDLIVDATTLAGSLSVADEKFDVVFLDPPFRQNVLTEVLEQLPRVLNPGARVYVETPQPLEADGAWRELKRGRAGQVSYQLLEWSDDRSSLSGDV